VSHTNTKLERIRADLSNTMVDINMKLDGKHKLK
jgi:hypothetical protein